MNITRFSWSLPVIEHIARHGVVPIEAEEVAFDNQVYARKGRDELLYLLGTTQAGRYLFMVVILTGRPGEVRIVTAREMMEKEKKYYQKRGK